jgi:DNA polymerase III alpha subunit
VVLEEAKHLGIPVLPPDINRSEDRFSVERVGTPPGRWAIRIGLQQVTQVGEELAKAILWERRGRSELRNGQDGPDGEQRFTTLAEVCQRLRPVGLTWPATEALTLVGAFDGLAPKMGRRRRLWQLHELWPLVSPTRKPSSPRGRQHSPKEAEQLTLAWALAPEEMEVPGLPTLDQEERVALDYQLLGLSARPHPLRLRRRALRRQGIRTIAELAEVPEGQVVRVAGWPISAQRPSTAKGMGFVVLEDETGRLPVAFPPVLAAELHRVIRSARVLVVAGRVERVRWYRSLLGFALQGVA